MKKTLILTICLILLNLFAYTDTENPTQNEAKYYDNAKVVRVKYSIGESFVQRSYDEGLEEATVNLPVFEKDKVGTTDGRVELYLGRSNYIRLDYDSEVILNKIPALRKTNLSLRISKGGIYLDIENIDHEKDIEIQTPDCGVFLLDRGIYRINVNQEGQTEVFVYDGIAEVAGDDYSRNVRENQKIVMSDGNVRERPYYFNSSEKDGFDQWNEIRNRTIGYSRHSSSRYLESGYEDHEYELSRSGRWRYESNYSTYIWIPYNISSYWRPYWHGRWVYHPFYGHVWSSYDSWGWYTHHYGRWHWSHYNGWYWIPGYRWSPAWVSWFWNDSYYGWCPLSYWNRPLIVLNKRWMRNYHYRGGIPFHSRSNTIIRKNQLSSSRIHSVALKRSQMSRFSGKSLAYRGNAPRGKLIHSKLDVVNAHGRSVQYKKGGIVSANKYRTSAGVNKGSKSRTTYKYSGRKLSRDKTYKYSSSARKSRSSYRDGSSKTYQTRTKSINQPQSRTYKSRSKNYGRQGKSPKRYSPPAKRSSSGKSKTKTKKRGSSQTVSKRYSSSTNNYNSDTSRYSSRSNSYSSRNSNSKTTNPRDKSYQSLSKSKYYSPSTSSRNKSYTTTKRYSSNPGSTGSYSRSNPSTGYRSRSSNRSYKSQSNYKRYSSSSSYQRRGYYPSTRNYSSSNRSYSNRSSSYRSNYSTPRSSYQNRSSYRRSTPRSSYSGSRSSYSRSTPSRSSSSRSSYSRSSSSRSSSRRSSSSRSSSSRSSSSSSSRKKR